MQPKRVIHIRIRDLRRERELTQEELAEALGISRQSINAMEAGRCLPSLPVALQIAAYFAVPLQRLIAIADENERALAAAVENGATEAPALGNPWEPLREMRDMLDDFMGDAPRLEAGPTPLVNMKDEGEVIVVEMQLPGFSKEDLTLEITDDQLTVSAELMEATQPESGQVTREFARRAFTRTLMLPAVVQSDHADAKMKNGILTVRLPKRMDDRRRPKRLEIQ
ncbi:MAG TPA: Hsp20 family protein [Verrucomicrobiae bacterium]|nr:Hsp20 family protein [Verrucomicrobiae bacterium]